MNATDTNDQPHEAGQVQAPPVTTGGASSSLSAPTSSPPSSATEGGDCFGAAMAASLPDVAAFAQAKKSSKARKGPRRPRFEVTLTQAKLAQAMKTAESCSVSLPELVRNWLDGFEEKMLHRAEAHAKAEGGIPQPPAAE